MWHTHCETIFCNCQWLSAACARNSSLLPMTGRNFKNHWSWRLISPSLTLSTSCQSSSQITAPVHSLSVNSPSVNSPSNFLIPIMLLIIFAPLHPSISTCTFIFCTSITPVFKLLNCNHFASMAYLLPLPPLSYLICTHCTYTFFSILLLTVCLFIPCVTLCCCLCRTTLLYLGQVAVVIENLFLTSLPG